MCNINSALCERWVFQHALNEISSPDETWKILHIIDDNSYNLSVADPGFSPGGAPTPKVGVLTYFFRPKTAWKWKNLGPRGGGARPWRPPLDPPLPVTGPIDTTVRIWNMAAICHIHIIWSCRLTKLIALLSKCESAMQLHLCWQECHIKDFLAHVISVCINHEVLNQYDNY